MAIGINSYLDLKVWQMAMALAEQAYRLTARFPKDEVYGMTARLARLPCRSQLTLQKDTEEKASGVFIQFLRMSQGVVEGT